MRVEKVLLKVLMPQSKLKVLAAEILSVEIHFSDDAF